MDQTFSNNKINNNDDNKQWQHSNQLGKVDPLTNKIKHQKIMTINLEIRWGGGMKITFSNNTINNNNENKKFDFYGWGISKMLIS